MDSVFFEQPVLLLFFAAAAALNFLLFKMQNDKNALYFALLNIAFHSAALCVMLISGASNEDVLLFLLFSAAMSLLRPKVLRARLQSSLPLLTKLTKHGKKPPVSASDCPDKDNREDSGK